MSRCPRRLGPVLLLAAAVLVADSARAESAVVLDYPDFIGPVDAATYDLERRRVGKAQLLLEELENGNLRMHSNSGFTGGVRTVVKADLAPIEGQHKLRPVFQESRSFNADGSPRGVLSIDHVKQAATCLDASGALVGETELPAGDRVMNVPLNLLFQPVARGEVEKIYFQLFLCSGGSRLIDFVASVAPPSGNGDGAGKLIEVRYGPNFGIATLVARSFVPKLSFWFDAEAPRRWMGHRLPLYGDGPEVFVVRDGVPPRWLGDE